MPPKAPAPSGKKAKNDPKKKQGKGAADDDDDDLLNQLQATAEVAAKKLAEEQKKEEQKKAEKAKAEEEQRKLAAIARAVAIAKLGPLFIDEVSQKLYEMMKTEDGGKMVNPCWMSYVLNNFLAFCVESKREIKLRTPAAPEVGEAILSFEVDDLGPEDGSPHSWNVLTTQSGVHAIDLALHLFQPNGRYGFKANPKFTEEAFVAVPAHSRLVKDKSEDGAAHVGVVASDGGILPDTGKTVVADGVPAETTSKYIAFLRAAGAHRFSKMSKAEEKTARNITGKVVNQFIDFHKKLEEKFFPF